MSHQSEQQHTGLDRREFLGRATAAVAAMAVVPGVFMVNLGNARPLDPRPMDQGVSNKVRWGMLIDTTKCATGCDACVRACNEENGLHSLGRPETDAQW